MSSNDDAKRERQIKLMSIIHDCCSELGWIAGIAPPDDDSTKVPGMFIGTESWVTAAAEACYPGQIESIEAYSSSGEVELEQSSIPNKKQFLH